MKHINFGSIEQFRNVVKRVRDRAEHHGTPLPVLKFHGTVKLHGTNASIVKDLVTDHIYTQSRSNVLSLEADNAGYARFFSEHPEAAFDLFNQVERIARAHPIEVIDENLYMKPFTFSHIAIFGEWCGGSIQKGVALNQLPRMFVVFAVFLTDASVNANGSTDGFWFTPTLLKQLRPSIPEVKNIEDFPTYDVEVDFNAPELAQNKFVDLTLAVEACCPFSDQLGVRGVGEGIVWINDVENALRSEAETLTFKTKGEKHSDSKTKTIVPIDVERVNSLKEFAANVLTEVRLQKMFDKLIERGIDAGDIKNTGVFLKTVADDVVKEESDTIAASGFTTKEVMSALSTRSRAWYMEKLKELVGL